jgi:hypothetical protein
VRGFFSTAGVWAVAAAALCSPTTGASAADDRGVDGGSTNPATRPADGTLEIVITAIEGHAEVKETPDGVWHRIAVSQIFSEGCQFRTGPRSSVQFTVGPDQIFRVDRLSLVRVVRANLHDGKIKTTVIMTYGRISKDLDTPIAPHDDTIVSPCSILAVRGTRVSLYDQPPYEPEAVSLTGAAVYSNLRGQLTRFGSKGGGTVILPAEASSAAQNQVQAGVVDPRGAFSGRSDSEEPLLSYLTGLGGVFNSLQIVRGTLSPSESLIGALQVQGALFFVLEWTGSASTVVDYSVTSPLGEVVSNTITERQAASGGVYNTNSHGSAVANSAGIGRQEIDWSANSPGPSYPLGTYTLTETLEGTTTQTLAQNHVAVTATQSALQMLSNGQQRIPLLGTSKLDFRSPTASYEFTVPIIGQLQFKRLAGDPVP